MTSISSSTMIHQSPRAMMDARISAATSAGTISQTDQTALESALDAIDSSLASDRAAGTKPSGDIKTRIDSLIQQQVDAGTLTDDQADELQSFFAEGPNGASSMEGPRGPGGPGGPPPPPPGCGDGTDSDDSTDASDVTAQKLDTLIAFLTKLRESLSSSLYGTESMSSSSSDNTGLVVNATA